METALEERKQKILRRLETTIESVNCILYEINQELENMIENNTPIEKTALIYETWISKE